MGEAPPAAESRMHPFESPTSIKPQSQAFAIIVMGVTGCGKTVVGEKLAARLGCRFLEGDAMHPPENVARMSSGNPLTDTHRQGWLDAIGAQIAHVTDAGESVVATCSALKRSYRDRLRHLCGPLTFVHLEIDKDSARLRVKSRKGHFMPESLVDSQFADLESLDAEEQSIALDATRPINELVIEAILFVDQTAQRTVAF